MANKATKTIWPNWNEDTQMSLGAIYEACWRLESIIKTIPTRDITADDGCKDYASIILQEHGAECIKTILNALETLGDSGFNPTMENAFETLRRCDSGIANFYGKPPKDAVVIRYSHSQGCGCIDR